mmetsp:Transcript_8090/g.28424  ORF Transcript_8090/g.28424 Transcript_8090/m.28424 type:complete len:228 (+) Transcript_8090:467-1150(+)
MALCWSLRFTAMNAASLATASTSALRAAETSPSLASAAEPASTSPRSSPSRRSISPARCLSSAPPPWRSTWFTTMRLHGTPSPLRLVSSLALSLTPRTVGMVAMTNSVLSWSRKRSRTSCSCSLSASSLRTASSWSSSAAPNRLFTADVALVSLCLSRTIFPTLLSRNSGSVRSRRVCPVGAVSKTILVNLPYRSCFVNWTTFVIATASSSPGGGVSSSSPSLRSAS